MTIGKLEDLKITETKISEISIKVSFEPTVEKKMIILDVCVVKHIEEWRGQAGVEERARWIVSAEDRS